MEMLKRNIESLNPKFKMNIEAKQWSDMLADSRTGKEAMIAIAWAPDYADPRQLHVHLLQQQGLLQPAPELRRQERRRVARAGPQHDGRRQAQPLYTLVGNRAFDTAPFILTPAGVNFTAFRSNLKGVSKATYNPMMSFSYTGTFWKDLSK
jgi:peptide/nickel transport system substrate-binding protein